MSAIDGATGRGQWKEASTEFFYVAESMRARKLDQTAMISILWSRIGAAWPLAVQCGAKVLFRPPLRIEMLVAENVCPPVSAADTSDQLRPFSAVTTVRPIGGSAR